jgi:hypothetical protein
LAAYSGDPGVTQVGPAVSGRQAWVEVHAGVQPATGLTSATPKFLTALT